MPVSFKGDTEETIMEALDALDTIEPSSEQHAEKIEAQRRHLVEELGKARTQGSLF